MSSRVTDLVLRGELLSLLGGNAASIDGSGPVGEGQTTHYVEERKVNGRRRHRVKTIRTKCARSDVDARSASSAQGERQGRAAGPGRGERRDVLDQLQEREEVWEVTLQFAAGQPPAQGGLPHPVSGTK